jgi:cytoskeleton-associated protein 5
LISKCLNGRAKMKERAFDIILMYVEIEKQVDVEEELVKGLENKQPKVVQACLELLRKGLSYVLEFRFFFYNEFFFFIQ